MHTKTFLILCLTPTVTHHTNNDSQVWEMVGRCDLSGDGVAPVLLLSFEPPEGDSFGSEAMRRAKE